MPRIMKCEDCTIEMPSGTPYWKKRCSDCYSSHRKKLSKQRCIKCNDEFVGETWKKVCLACFRKEKSEDVEVVRKFSFL